ncbi:Calcium-dependent protein kinase 1 [Porphyridium purpureum]|uniref:Calcium-dependent protein kinase 1 n=1 Tax=Porphyridium purpureum TaxID=35688 RepID=A0A5J4YRS7_PORPP|nr:Calcium-dependent protein kinase 1 [Porphyridium purpureum]|eukprot:POR2836..scf229_5
MEGSGTPRKCNSDSALLLQPRELVYRGIFLKGVLGAGGQAKVYVATNVLGQEIAVKAIYKVFREDNPNVPCPRQRVQVQDEIFALSAVRHRSVLRLLDHVEDSDAYYIITEYIPKPGGDLFERLAVKSMTENEILVVVKQVAEALAAIHAKGIAHRDVKLENIMVEESEYEATGLQTGLRAKLIDFGLAHAPAHDGADLELAPFAQPGTALYQAPECLSCEPRRDLFANDMYALGVCMYIACCGEYPFYGTSARGVQRRQRECGDKLFTQSIWHKVTRAAKAIIACLLSQDVDARPTALELADSIQQILKARGIAPQEVRPQKQRPSLVGSSISSQSSTHGSPTSSPGAGRGGAAGKFDRLVSATDASSPRPVGRVKHISRKAWDVTCKYIARF